MSSINNKISPATPASEAGTSSLAPTATQPEASKKVEGIVKAALQKPGSIEGALVVGDATLINFPESPLKAVLPLPTPAPVIHDGSAYALHLSDNQAIATPSNQSHTAFNKIPDVTMIVTAVLAGIRAMGSFKVLWKVAVLKKNLHNAKSTDTMSKVEAQFAVLKKYREENNKEYRHVEFLQTGGKVRQFIGKGFKKLVIGDIIGDVTPETIFLDPKASASIREADEANTLEAKKAAVEAAQKALKLTGKSVIYHTACALASLAIITGVVIGTALGTKVAIAGVMLGVITIMSIVAYRYIIKPIMDQKLPISLSKLTLGLGLSSMAAAGISLALTAAGIFATPIALPILVFIAAAVAMLTPMGVAIHNRLLQDKPVVKKELKNAFAQTEKVQTRDAQTQADDGSLEKLHAAEQMVNRLKSEKDALEIKCKDLEKRIGELKAKLAELEKDNAANKVEIQALRDQLTTYKKDLEASQADLKKTREELKLANLKIKDLEKELQATKTQLQDAQKKYQSTRKELQDSLAKVKGELEAEKRKAGGLEQKLDAAAQRENGLKSERDALRTKCKALEKRVGELEARLAELEKDGTGNRAEIQALRNQLAEYKNRLDASQEELKKTQEELKLANLKVEGLEKDLKTTKTQLQETQKKYESTRDELDELKKQHEELKRLFDGATNKNRELEGRIKSVEDENKGLKDRVKQLTIDLSAERAANRQLKKDLDDEKTKNTLLQLEAQKSAAVAKQALEDLGKLVKENAELREANKKQGEELEKSKKQLADLEKLQNEIKDLKNLAVSKDAELQAAMEEFAKSQKDYDKIIKDLVGTGGKNRGLLMAMKEVMRIATEFKTKRSPREQEALYERFRVKVITLSKEIDPFYREIKEKQEKLNEKAGKQNFLTSKRAFAA